MSRGTSDRNLLVGMLAFQNGFVRREQLLSAMNAWLVEKQTPLEEILLRQGALNSDQQQLLVALVRQHLAMHDNVAERSLAAISSLGSVGDELRSLADPDLNAGLQHVTVGGADHDRYATMAPTIGVSTSQGGRFRIVRPHARGGLGEVHVALDTELNREVALKEIQARHADHPQSRARFTLEAEITGGLEHPSIVPVYGLGTYADGRPYYAMRFIRGDSLKEAIELYHKADRPQLSGEGLLELRKLLGRFIDVCNAVEYAHSRGVLHRDLKPGNIMLGKYGETLVVDWGLAKALGAHPGSNPWVNSNVNASSYEPPLIPSSGSGSAPTQIGSALGTPAYMSPEQAAGRLDELRPASDVYSLGATFYHLLTGQSPFHSDSEDIGELLRKVQGGALPPPRSLNKDIPKSLEAICLKAMAHEQEDRYRSAAALADDVEHWLADEPVTANAETIVERTARLVRRHRAWALASVAVLVIVAAVSIVAVVAINERNQENKRLADNEKRARTEADAKRQEAQLQAARLMFEQGWSKYREGDSKHAVLLMAGSLVNLQSFATSSRDASLDLMSHAQQLETSVRAHLLHLTLSSSFQGSVIPHHAPATPISLSADGKELATSCDDNVTKLWDLATGEAGGARLHIEETIFPISPGPDGKKQGALRYATRAWDVAKIKPLRKPLLHAQMVIAVSYSPDGTKLATASMDNAVRVWQLKTGKELIKPLEHNAPVVAIAFSPDSANLATASLDDTARVWEVVTGTPLNKPIRHGDLITTVAFSPDGDTLATASFDKTARLWDIATGEALGDVLHHGGPVFGVSFSPEGTRLATASADRTARLWDPVTGKQLAKMLHHEDDVLALCFNPRGTMLATASADMTARVLDVITGKPLQYVLKHRGPVTALSFSFDGRMLATASADKTARLWDVATGKSFGQTLGHGSVIRAVSFCSDDSKLVTASQDHTAWAGYRALDVQLGEVLEHAGQVRAVAFSPDGTKLATGSLDNTARLWDVSSGKPIGEPLQHGVGVASVCFSTDGQLLCTAGFSNTIRKWDVASGKQFPEVFHNEGRLTAISFSPDGTKLATTTWDKGARVWDAATGKLIGHPFQYAAPITGIAFGPDGTKLATASWDQTVRVWDVNSGEMCGEPLFHQGDVSAVCFSPDGTQLVSASQTLQFWHLASGKTSGELLRHGEAFNTLAFSPDGTTIVSASGNNVQFWNVATGKPLGQPLQHGNTIHAIAFSPDGRRLATASSDNTARIWDVPGKLVESTERLYLWAQSLTGGELSDAGTLRQLSGDKLYEVQERLRKEGGPPSAFGQVLERRKQLAKKFAKPNEEQAGLLLTP